jgi:Anti-sigma-K factor rskA
MSRSAENWSELLAGYVLGDLTLAEITAVEEHLAAHPEAQVELRQLQNTLAIVPCGLTGEIAEPPQSLRDQILQGIQPAIAPVRTQRRSVKLLWATGALVIAGIVGGLGWHSYRLDQQLQVAKQEITKQQSQLAQQAIKNQQDLLAQAGNRLLPVASINPQGEYTSGTTGSLVISPQMNKAVLVLQKVPALPNGKVYRMWAMLGKEEMACADFVPDRQGQRW